MNKQEIKDELVAKGIDFNEDATNKELLALLPEEEEKEDDKEEEEKDETNNFEGEKEEDEEEELSEVDKKLSPFLRAYKKQNPKKYKAKLANGELNGL